MTGEEGSSYSRPVMGIEEAAKLIGEIEPDLERLSAIEQGIIARIKESEKCNSAGLLYLQATRNYLARAENDLEQEINTKESE